VFICVHLWLIPSVRRVANPRIIFITGTDTGVGKTIVTSLLLCHLRQSGCHALAIKPFCSGGRADAQLLHDLQDGELTLDEINPFHFKEPLAPLVAARLHRRKISIRATLGCIENAIRKIHHSSIPSFHRSNSPSIHSPVLLIEGAGGLLSPLGERFNLLDLIKALAANAPIQNPESSIQAVVASPNRLGTINHTFLSVDKLQRRGVADLKIVLMNVSAPRRSTPDARYNRPLIQEFLSPLPVFSLPYLGRRLFSPRALKVSARRFKGTLTKIVS
jgi:dethiobiotin synthetase